MCVADHAALLLYYYAHLLKSAISNFFHLSMTPINKSVQSSEHALLCPAESGKLHCAGKLIPKSPLPAAAGSRSV